MFMYCCFVYGFILYYFSSVFKSFLEIFFIIFRNNQIRYWLLLITL